MTALLAAIVTASLLGSLHCAGMCGPLAAFAVGGNLAAPRAQALTHAAYHAGRLVTYALLGAACGGLGHMIDLGGKVAGVQQAAAILAGTMMVAFGAVAGLRSLGVRISEWPAPAVLTRVVTAGHRAAVGMTPVARSATIGVLTGLLPCGWLYAFAITAAGTGNPLSGAAVMAAFWIGTVPVLLALGIGVNRLSAAVGRRAATVMSLMVVALGVLMVVERSRVASAVAAAGHSPPPTVSAAAESVATLNSAEMPCCHGR
ncbi:hypothetical protein RAS1_28210 [Phycisphaerae bacterium RAS1]|nr:hypothetical protein RAS1_28210 [Phycisphaerae bacterium RAS1]